MNSPQKKKKIKTSEITQAVEIRDMYSVCFTSTNSFFIFYFRCISSFPDEKGGKGYGNGKR